MVDPSNRSSRDAMEILERQARDISPESFKQAYDCVVAASPDRRVLARLLWLAGMYLGRHPGAFELPRALAEEFLASDDYDELLAGLKGIRYSSASTSDIIAHFLAAMKRNAWEERYAGLYQLHQVVCEDAASVVAATEQSVLDDMQVLFAEMASQAPDDDAREVASRCSLAVVERREE